MIKTTEEICDKDFPTEKEVDIYYKKEWDDKVKLMELIDDVHTELFPVYGNGWKSTLKERLNDEK